MTISMQEEHTKSERLIISTWFPMSHDIRKATSLSLMATSQSPMQSLQDSIKVFCCWISSLCDLCPWEVPFLQVGSHGARGERIHSHCQGWRRLLSLHRESTIILEGDRNSSFGILRHTIIAEWLCDNCQRDRGGFDGHSLRLHLSASRLRSISKCYQQHDKADQSFHKGFSSWARYLQALLNFYPHWGTDCGR